jgi:SseB protein N-terminal domain
MIARQHDYNLSNMKPRNRHGLSRHIKADVKRAIRRHCGFGCVLCGRAIVVYHHFDPPFRDALEHRAEGITLLCPTCHTKVENDFISSNVVEAANANPAGRQQGYAHDDVLFESKQPHVRLGGTDFFCQYPIIYGREIILGFENPEEPGAPMRLQAKLYGASGKKVFEIIDNEWRVGSDLFDVTTIKNRLEIRESAGRVVLALRFSSDLGLDIEQLDMVFRDCEVKLQGNSISIKREGIMNMQLGKVNAMVGVLFGLHGEVSCAVSGLPFLENAINDFRPNTECERLLVRSRDGAEEWNRFIATLRSENVFVLAETNMRKNEPGKMHVTMLRVDDKANPDVVVLTAMNRLEKIQKRMSIIGKPRSIRFDHLILGMNHEFGLILNPFSSAPLHISASLLQNIRKQLLQ